MFDLSPVKILVILVVALVVLGPEKLPGLARQLGAAWGDLRRWRERMEREVRGTFPDLPSTATITQAVRSPLSFLDRLADEHERTLAADERAAAADDTTVGTGPVGAAAPGSTNGATEASAGGASGATGNGAQPGDGARPGGDGRDGGPKAHDATGDGGVLPAGVGGRVESGGQEWGRFGAVQGADGFLPPPPDDPTMN